jgi:hypothetical protein
MRFRSSLESGFEFAEAREQDPCRDNVRSVAQARAAPLRDLRDARQAALRLLTQPDGGST